MINGSNSTSFASTVTFLVGLGKERGINSDTLIRYLSFN